MVPAFKPFLKDGALFKTRSYVAGSWIDAADGSRFHVHNPADGQVIGDVAALNAAQATSAVDAADAAYADWSGCPSERRAELLRRWHDQIFEHREDLALLMTLEQGKPLSEAKGEIGYGADFIAFYAEEAIRLKIEGIPSHFADAELTLSREPVGVAALVTPWNFPSAMITRKAAPALAAGCTIVIHPSAETPYSALALAELAERAGFPPGVVNVVTGHAPVIVPAWTQDQRVRALSFTGSTGIGRLLYEQSAGTIKLLSLELGGHAPFIVFDDADLDRAVRECIKAKFATSGQDCLAANRIFIARPLYAAFCRAYAETAAGLSIGPGVEDRDLGPLINRKAVLKQEEHVRDAVSRGAKLLCGGECSPCGPLFYPATVLADVPADALIMRDETFGPVAALCSFDDEDEVVARANDTEYGLVAYVHTQNVARMARLAERLQYGMVAFNRTRITGSSVPFGGVKQSGIGREGSSLGIEAFTQVKYVCRQR